MTQAAWRRAMAVGSGFLLSVFCLNGCSMDALSKSIWSDDPSCFGRSFSDPDEAADAELLCAGDSEVIDAQSLVSRAKLAEATGKYSEALLLYLGACDEIRTHSCYRAAELWDRGIVDDMPPVLAVYLYQLACKKGHKLACEHPSQQMRLQNRPRRMQ